jgi:hypothetical protein
VWARLAGGCHLSRRATEGIAAAGPGIERLEAQRLPGGVPLVAGVARVGSAS